MARRRIRAPALRKRKRIIHGISFHRCGALLVHGFSHDLKAQTYQLEAQKNQNVLFHTVKGSSYQKTSWLVFTHKSLGTGEAKVLAQRKVLLCSHSSKFSCGRAGPNTQISLRTCPRTTRYKPWSWQGHSETSKKSTAAGPSRSKIPFSLPEQSHQFSIWTPLSHRPNHFSAASLCTCGPTKLTKVKRNCRKPLKEDNFPPILQTFDPAASFQRN